MLTRLVALPFLVAFPALAQVTVGDAALTDLVVATSLPQWTPETVRIRAGQPVTDLLSFLGQPLQVSAWMRQSEYESGVVTLYQVDEGAQSVAPGSSAAVGVHDRLLTFAGLTGIGRLEVEWEVTAPPGTALPLLQVDIGNDGSIELTGTVPGGLQLSRPAPGGTFVVRLRTGAALAGVGLLSSRVIVRLVPADPIQFVPTQPSCGAGTLRYGAVFGRQVVLGTDHGLLFRPTEIQVLVFGLSQSPLPLPGGCVILPARDALLFTPVGEGIRIRVPLPVVFDVQAAVVDLSTAVFRTSSAVQVVVN